MNAMEGSTLPPKCFAENVEKAIEEKSSLYSIFLMVAANIPNALAYIDFKTGRKVTYKELLAEIDAFANGLNNLGLSGYYRVGMLGFNCCIDPVVLLGANKLGVPVVFVGPDGSPSDIAENIRYVDVLVIQNVFAELEPLINVSGIPVIIYGQLLKLPSEHCCRYEDFISNGAGNNVNAIVSTEDMDAMVIFSSGSTGIAKPIVHSNCTVAAAVRKMMYSDFPIDDSSYLVKVIPSHISLGSITTMLTGLLSGVPYVQISGLPNPAVDMAQETLELITTFASWKKQNKLVDDRGLIIFAAPMFARYYLSKVEEIHDLSALKGILFGGSKMLKGELDTMETIFKQKGLQVPICNGYGQNEMGGAVALNTVHHNKNGSAGYPVVGTKVKIVDRDTLEEVGINAVGLVVEQSDSQFVRYLGMPDRTAQAEITLADGSKWFNSTDLGYIDEDGFLYITGRTTRVVIRWDHKVSLDVIEEKMKALPEIADAAVVQNESEQEIVAFIATNTQLTAEEILGNMKAGGTPLSVFEIPDRIRKMPDLPKMNNGKIDYRLLSAKAKTE